jgi:hypothetical protein
MTASVRDYLVWHACTYPTGGKAAPTAAIAAALTGTVRAGVAIRDAGAHR